MLTLLFLLGKNSQWIGTSGFCCCCCCRIAGPCLWPTLKADLMLLSLHLLDQDLWQRSGLLLKACSQTPRLSRPACSHVSQGITPLQITFLSVRCNNPGRPGHQSTQNKADKWIAIVTGVCLKPFCNHADAGLAIGCNDLILSLAHE